MCYSPEAEQATNQIMSPPTTRALEAISLYPILRHLITHLIPKDIYNLSLAHSILHRTLNLRNPNAHQSLLSRCIRICPGPPCWGFPQGMYFLKPIQHQLRAENPNEDMDVKICGRAGCWLDACKYCRQSPPLHRETRRRWICPTCLPHSSSSPPSPCTCCSATNIYCPTCAIEMTNQDEAYYDFNKFLQTPRIVPPGLRGCKKSDCADFCYECWECGVRGSPPYQGAFVCRWCLGRVGYVEIHPRDVKVGAEGSCEGVVGGVDLVVGFF